MKTTRKYWIFSFLIHSLLLAILQVPWTFFSKPLLPIQLELVEKTEPSLRFQSGKTDAVQRKNQIRKFVPDYTRGTSKETFVNADTLGSSDEERQIIGKTWDTNFYYAPDFSAIAKYSVRSAFYRELHRAIDSHILFEHRLAEYDHFGYVFFRFAVNVDGTLIPETLRASAQDRVLKVFAARALRAALAQPVAESLRLKSDLAPIWLATRFSYESRKNGCKTKTPPETSWLSFCRWSSDGPNHKDKWEMIYDSVESRYTQREETDSNPNKHEVAVMSTIPLAEDDYIKRHKAKELGFNPFLKEEQDPDWEL